MYIRICIHVYIHTHNIIFYTHTERLGPFGAQREAENVRLTFSKYIRPVGACQ